MQRQAGDDQIEAGRARTAAIPRPPPRTGRRSAPPSPATGRTHHLDAARPQQRRHHAAPADIQRVGEPAGNIVQPVQQPLGRIAQHVGHARPRSAPHGRDAGAPRARSKTLIGSMRAMCARRPCVAKPPAWAYRPPQPGGTAMKHIDATTLRGWITDGQELAMLDAREDGEFGASHLFWAVPCGLARGRSAPARCCRGWRCASAASMTAAGWPSSSPTGWKASAPPTSPCWTAAPRPGQAAGYVLFSGINVPSKAFGEWVEHHYGTESVDPPELKAWIDGGRDMVVLDSRTLGRVHPHVDPHRHQRARRRAGLPHRRPGARPRRRWWW